MDYERFEWQSFIQISEIKGWVLSVLKGIWACNLSNWIYIHFNFKTQKSKTEEKRRLLDS